MKQLVQNYKTGELSLLEIPAPAIRPGFVLVRNIHSLISAGTEKSKVDLARKSLIGKAKARPDMVQKVISTAKREGLANTFHKVMGKLDTPSPLGYSCAGKVLAVGAGVEELSVGDLVACAGAGYANHAEVVIIPKNLCVRLPHNVPTDVAAFATVGAIALQGIRQAEPHLGEIVVVIGLGLLGQLTVQMLKAQACLVIGVDIDPAKVALAREHGADAGAVRGVDDVERLVLAMTAGRGADAVIITAAASTNDPVELAGAIARDRGRVVVVGLTPMELPRELYYQKELELRLSRSYGPGRYDNEYEEQGHDYPIGYVRWTEQRNMQAFLMLAANGKITLEKIITHRFPFADAVQAYQLLVAGTGSYIGILLEYSDVPVDLKAPIITREVDVLPKRSDSGQLRLGLIGAGSFAKGTLLPNMRAAGGAQLVAVTTSSGLSARDVADKFGAERCCHNADDIINADDIDAIIVATRHNSHADLAARALASGKPVFVEKPLAVDEEQLVSVNTAWRENGGLLLIGFNRRFAPMTAEVRQYFQGRVGPMIANIRVNAGLLPAEHWLHGADQGGRLVGEACHFVDLLCYVVGSQPLQVFGVAAPAPDLPLTACENASIVVSFADGSIGVVSYFANGSADMGKERFEFSADGRSAVIDDFRVLRLHTAQRTITRKFMSQDKGHKGEMIAFIRAVRGEQSLPFSFAEQYISSLCTLRAIRSIADCHCTVVGLQPRPECLFTRKFYLSGGEKTEIL